ncbi:monocarboxylate transporter 14 [Plakobranchus ocellatus]|uniref:Monocarboxylate transporter 14 n=1 Tax=Plakobranchus ocellatus TaxID=259542 RepID=A0AAV4DZH0_9GAST|nr:monocarboxylate transporter 14 [Plakobranchus ocellatus]
MVIITPEGSKEGDGTSRDGSIQNIADLGAGEPGDNIECWSSMIREIDHQPKFDYEGIALSDHCDSEIGSAGDLARDAFASDKNISGTDAENRGKEDGEEVSDENIRNVPDGGYGWFIVVASCLSHTLIGGLERSDGIFFLQIEDRFQKSAALTAWPCAIASMTRLLASPVTSELSLTYSVRASCMVGAVLLFAAHFTSAFSPSIFFLIGTCGLLQGLARSLLYLPSLVIVNDYFDVRQPMATGFATSGVGVGTLFVVPLIQYLFEEFSFRGGFIVISAISLQFLFIAMLFRPLFLHNKFSGYKWSSPEKPSASETMMLSEMADAGDLLSIRSVHFCSTTTVNQDAETGGETSHSLLPPTLTINPSAEKSVKKTPSHIVPVTSHVKKDGCLRSALKILFPKGPKRDKKDCRIFHFQLLKNLSFTSFCLSICLFTAAFKSAFTFIPALANSQGMSEREAVIVLSVSGAVDTLGRILAGLILNWSVLESWRLAIFSILMFAITVVCCFMPILGGSFLQFCVFSSLLGVLTGMLVSQKSVLCKQILGAARAAQSFGLLLLFQGLGVMAGPPLAGACRDYFGRYDEAFYLCAGMMFVAACIMVISTVLHRRDQQKPVNQAKSV